MVRPQLTCLRPPDTRPERSRLVNGHLVALRLRDATLAFVASLLLCPLPGSYVAAAPIELADILDIDPLGYRCIPSKYFDDEPDGTTAVAFSLSGKTRLPRTCLPDPCARALSPQELSHITGTEPILARFSDEWDDYYSRYADHCVREIVVSRPRTNEGFWKPIIDRSQDNQRLGIPTSSRLIPFIITNYVPPDSARAVPVSFSTTSTSIGPINQPSPVPLPASGLLLALLMGAAAYLSRKAKRTATGSSKV